ncbi:MAG: hemolysin III family protein [Castellaniella sp.]|uniref:PAQR family membrane homeostasis protein TrhA n=1 Tax=Castellaniella sp. TaxID=1955812 RepID=UPI00120451AB|nr:hemolysin III family protein [Castellaniella sp.]TAN30043.1 MAG: hemolysin III family protein [Castellaniella sp.]
MVYGERFNSISHLVGAVLAVIGMVLLIVLGARAGDPWKVVSFSVYGTMLLCLYLASTLYHSLQGRARRVWCKFDHCSIYLLIAGSYTPFTLVSLRGPWGWSLFGTVWGLALVGIIQEIWIAHGKRLLSLALYVLMGWLAAIAAPPLLQALGRGFLWLAGGGVVYTAGILFYMNDHRWRHAHGIWHLFVLVASALQYVAVLGYVA